MLDPQSRAPRWRTLPRPRFGLLLSVAGFVSACSASGPRDDAGAQRAGQPEDRPIAVAKLSDSPSVQARVLRMAFADVAKRLGSLRYEAESHFEFSRDTREVSQRDHYDIARDASGNVHVVLDTNKKKTEIYVVGETLYVRHDAGPMRRKSRQQVYADRWPELAWSSLRDSIRVFRPYITFGAKTPTNFAGRQASRFRLGLADAPQRVAPPQPRKPTDAPIAVNPLASWRMRASPLDLNGTLTVDDATGVPLALELEGRVEIADRQVRPTQLRFEFDGQLKDIAEVAAIEPPPSRPEFERAKPPHEPLSFFREHLPATAQPPANGSQPE